MTQVDDCSQQTSVLRCRTLRQRPRQSLSRDASATADEHSGDENSEESFAADQFPRSFEDAERLVHVVAGRRTLTVLTELARGGRRYQDLHDTLDGIWARLASVCAAPLTP